MCGQKQYNIANSYPVRDDVINEVFPFRFCLTVVLLVAFPQVKQKTEGHHPHLILCEVQLGKSVIEKPGKQFFTAYSACVFFASGSLSTLRRVPL